jgi:hypothetical protein
LSELATLAAPAGIQYLARRVTLFARALAYVSLPAAALVILVLRLAFPVPRNYHFIYLANAFAHDTLAVDNLPPSYRDKIIYNDHIYIPMGPMPAILLVPVAALVGTGFDEGWASVALTLFNAWLLNRVLMGLGVLNSIRRRWMIALFFGGTIYLAISVVGNSWFLSHILTITFLFLAIGESFIRPRFWLAGFWLGAAFLTRATAAFGMAYFLYLIWRQQQMRLRTLLGLAAGFVPAAVFFLWYNYARFGNPFETGYANAMLTDPLLTAALSHGLFSPANIPKNLYALFLATPQPVPGWNAPVLQFPYIAPSPWGMSIFLTTPLFLYAFRAKLDDVHVVAAWLAVVSILIPLLLYYGIGWIQFGYRYATDFYPFLFIPTALALDRHFSPIIKWAVGVCILINLWGTWVSLLGSFAFT